MGYDVNVDILITTAISPGADYDLYSKLTDIPGPDLYDYKDDIIEIVEEAPEYEGTITEKELDYEDRWQTFPLYNIPAGTRVRVRITGRNDMASNQKMGAWWQVKDPDGYVVDEYENWETYWTGPGNEQEFRGGSFDLDKAGTYTIDVELFMNPDDQVCVDEYHGNLCTVIEEGALEPPEVDTLAAEDIEHDSATVVG
ncbi:unnamed protein product, partial [marine sediment metagenome]